MKFQSIAVVVITLAFAGLAVAKNTPIATCPFVISAPGHYFLAADLGPCAGPFAIQIAVSDVRLRLEGHTITCSAGGTDGISAKGAQKIKIEGPGTITSCSLGITWQNVDNSSVREVTAPANASGFVIGGGSDNRFIRNVVSDNSLFGIFLSGANNSSLEDNVANNNDQHSGITLISGGGDKLTGNTTNGNGLALREGSGVCGGGGILLGGSSGNQIAGNTANNNCSGGIGLGTGSTENQVVENTALGNHDFDLFDFNPNCDANQWVANIFATSNQGCIH
jgi:parallel beta-helix repeat protein